MIDLERSEVKRLHTGSAQKVEMAHFSHFYILAVTVFMGMGAFPPREAAPNTLTLDREGGEEVPL